MAPEHWWKVRLLRSKHSFEEISFIRMESNDCAEQNVFWNFVSINIFCQDNINITDGGSGPFCVKINPASPDIQLTGLPKVYQNVKFIFLFSTTLT